MPTAQEENDLKDGLNANGHVSRYLKRKKRKKRRDLKREKERKKDVLNANGHVSRYFKVISNTLK